MEFSAPDPDHGLHGVLRYRRELIKRTISLLPFGDDPQSAWCEFCGKQLKHPLYLDHTQDPEEFCCSRYRELFLKVLEESRLLQELSAGFSQSACSDSEDQQEFGSAHWLKEELRLQQMEMEKFLMEAAAKPSSGHGSLYTINFKLSSCALLENHDIKDETCKKEEHSGSREHSCTDPSGPAWFGLCHHQENATFIEKFYSTGNKFLTAFPDGSAQVFYPSGNLAIIVLIDDTEAVCIVYDDDVLPNCPIRALFSSQGRVTCYHHSGSIWLSMDKWGGQCLNDNGARTRKWSWTDHSNNPITMRPVCLSLNKNIGVRVLSRDSVFVCFLASGQQTRFSVGSRSKTVDSSLHCPRPAVHKDELMVQVCQFCVRLALVRSRWCLRLRSDPASRRPRVPQFLLSVRQRLLRLSSSIQMDDKDKVFIQNCLEVN